MTNTYKMRRCETEEKISYLPTATCGKIFNCYSVFCIVRPSIPRDSQKYRINIIIISQ